MLLHRRSPRIGTSPCVGLWLAIVWQAHLAGGQLRDQLRFVSVEMCADNGTVFDPLRIGCSACPLNSTSLEGHSCVCRPGFVQTRRLNYRQLECRPCAAGKIASQDRQRCLSCATSCSQCPEGSVLLEKETSAECRPCANHSLDDPSCSASEQRQTLIADTDPDFPVFRERSDLIARQITGAYERCNSGEDCSQLANLCVLSHYRMSQSQESPCTLYLKLTPTVGQRGPTNGPWIYYDEETPQTLYKTNLPNKFTLDPTKNSSFLSFHAITFDLDGHFVADGELNMRELIPCAQIPRRLPFAANVDVACRVSVTELRRQPLKLIDLYLVSDSRHTIYPVPVLVRNLHKNGMAINRLGRPETQWQLTRRLFTVDVKSVAKSVRFLERVDIRIRLQSWWDGRAPGSAYPPLVTLAYGRIKDDPRDEVQLRFRVHYEQIQSKTFQDISIAVGVLSTLVAMWACIRTWGWVRRNGSQSFGAVGIYKLLAYTCGGLADVFLLVLLCSCLNWLVMFKGQGIIHLLLPTAEQETEIITYIVVALALKGVEVLDMIVMQQDWDVFLIDWELTEGATAWRSYLIAGEFLKLATHRRLNIGLLLLVMLFALKVARLESLALAAPASAGISMDVSPYSSSCRLALVAGVYILAAVVYYVYMRVLHERFVGYNYMQRFVDLCSIANISVLTLTHSCHGYYVHGRSVLGKSDVSLWEILEQLRKEENDLCAHRGLIPDTDEQTFRISLLVQLKSQYKRLLDGAQAPPHNIEQVAGAHKAINRFLVAFLQHAVKDLDYVVKDAMAIETFLDVELSDVHDRCVFYKDPNGRTLEALLFSSFEKNLLVLNLLVLVITDWLSHDLVFASCLVYGVDVLIQATRTSLFKRNLVKKSLIDARFITT
ncbi:meckelin-like [Tropilaelaps mercedesae]|uniref:Meckelin-like n=1 Tax=Tropilaelaps mercedesae TaxID=418985 RepID=A0A1V9XYK1_9ACAR|nr:meckelin-like [Tropilaelaps mercedesae]